MSEKRKQPQRRRMTTARDVDPQRRLLWLVDQISAQRRFAHAAASSVACADHPGSDLPSFIRLLSTGLSTHAGTLDEIAAVAEELRADARAERA